MEGYLFSVLFLAFVFLAGCSGCRAFANSLRPITCSKGCKSGLCVLLFTQDARFASLPLWCGADCSSVTEGCTCCTHDSCLYIYMYIHVYSRCIYTSLCCWLYLEVGFGTCARQRCSEAPRFCPTCLRAAGLQRHALNNSVLRIAFSP